MKKALFVAILAMGTATVFTSCGGKKGTDASTTADSTSAGTPATKTSGSKVDEIFGGNLFFGAGLKTTEADAKKMNIPGSETNHDEARHSYSWNHTYEDGSNWGFGLDFTNKGKLDALDFSYDPLTNAEARAFSAELLKAIEAKDGKHTNEDTSGETDFDWDNEDYLIYMYAPEAGTKDVRVAYTISLLED